MVSSAVVSWLGLFQINLVLILLLSGVVDLGKPASEAICTPRCENLWNIFPRILESLIHLCTLLSFELSAPTTLAFTRFDIRLSVGHYLLSLSDFWYPLFVRRGWLDSGHDSPFFGIKPCFFQRLLFLVECFGFLDILLPARSLFLPFLLHVELRRILGFPGAEEDFNLAQGTGIGIEHAPLHEVYPVDFDLAQVASDLVESFYQLREGCLLEGLERVPRTEVVSVVVPLPQSHEGEVLDREVEDLPSVVRDRPEVVLLLDFLFLYDFDIHKSFNDQVIDQEQFPEVRAVLRTDEPDLEVFLLRKSLDFGEVYRKGSVLGNLLDLGHQVLQNAFGLFELSSLKIRDLKPKVLRSRRSRCVTLMW